MKREEITELRSKSIEDLQADITAKKQELMGLRFAKALEGTQSGTKGRILRRDIARLNTLIREQQLAAETN
jgi:large subunit ribosomal protein L29